MYNRTPTLAASISKHTLLRYQLIEIIAYWEGRITTSHLCNGFGIGRQQASRDINTYIRELASNNLEYDMQLRGYKPTANFNPLFTKGHINEYLRLLVWNDNLVSKSNYSTLGLREVSTISPPPRLIKPEIMRGIVRAISEKRRIEVTYSSMHSPEPEARIIAPHSLVDTPLKWYVRAYCEKNRDYRDFALSRFEDEPEFLDKSQNLITDDVHWCTPVNLVLQAHPSLNQHQRRLIENDYGMINEELIIPSSLALIKYLVKSLGLELTGNNDNPNEQHICIKNPAEINSQLNNKGLI